MRAYKYGLAYSLSEFAVFELCMAFDRAAHVLRAKTTKQHVRQSRFSQVLSGVYSRGPLLSPYIVAMLWWLYSLTVFCDIWLYVRM